MFKTAKIISIAAHPLFLSFYNFVFLILLIGAKGPVLGFLITLFFFAGVLIPVFYTFLVLFKDNKIFEWEHLTNMAIHSRQRILAYTVIYNVVFLLFIINLGPTFLGEYKAMFASIIMAFIFSMVLSFVSHLLKLKNSLHALSAAFFATFAAIFLWRIPDLTSVQNNFRVYLLILLTINIMALFLVSWSRLKLKMHSSREVLLGIFIGIISPLILTLLTYGI